MGKKPLYTYHFPPTDMFVPRLDGKLKEHAQTCPDCGGDGVFIDQCSIEGLEGPPERDDCDICHDCEGSGTLWWPSWYVVDTGRCDCCYNVAQVADLFSAQDEHRWICLPCYVRMHKEAECCDRWAWAEKRLELFMFSPKDPR